MNFRKQIINSCQNNKTIVFLLPAVLLLLFELMKISVGYWAGDFWTHAAVVKELSLHPINPENPIVDSPVPHAFFSPYALLVAFIARVLRLGPVDALEIFAVV